MSNSSLAVRAGAEAERSTAFGAITAAFLPIGTPLLFASLNLIFDNQTDTAIQISWDGVLVWKTFSAGQAIVLDIQSNRGRSETMEVAQATQFYIRYLVVPTSGSFYISSIYGNNSYNL